MFKTRAVNSPLTLDGVLLPFLILHLFLYGISFVLEGVVSPTSKTVFILLSIASIISLSVIPIIWLRRKNLWERGLLFPLPQARSIGLTLGAICLALFIIYFFIVMIDVSEMLTGLRYRGRIAKFAPFLPSELYYYPILILVSLNSAAEEVYFIGFLFRYLRGVTGLLAAMAITATLFTFSHMTMQIPYIIILMILSLTSQFFFLATGSLFYGIVVHAVTNFFAILTFTPGFWAKIYPYSNVKCLVLLLLMCLFFFTNKQIRTALAQFRTRRGHAEFFNSAVHDGTNNSNQQYGDNK